jgi:branched-subunit amino acid aminotransferase/4-amino-4-deoxychorismate lyase
MTYWLNGEFRDDPQAINIADRGFLLGDGLFETLLLDRAAPVFLERHLKRLRASSAALKIELQFSDDEIRDALRVLAVKNSVHQRQASARITLTRGAGARGLEMPSITQPTLIITVAPYDPHRKPASLIVSRHARAERSLAASHKTLNYLDNVMARDEAISAGANEAVMLNGTGRIACASAANIFLVTADKSIRTPSLEEGALAGVARSVLLECSGNTGVSIVETQIERHELKHAQLFLSNSLFGLRPALMKGGSHTLDPAFCEIMKRLQSCYSDAVERDLNGG